MLNMREKQEHKVIWSYAMIGWLISEKGYSLEELDGISPFLVVMLEDEFRRFVNNKVDKAIGSKSTSKPKTKKVELSIYEKAFCNTINEAKQYVSEGKELEINFLFSANKELNGWYAYEYSAEKGNSTPIYKNEYDTKPLCSESTEKKHLIDVYKCFDYCKVLYVGR